MISKIQKKQMTKEEAAIMIQKNYKARLHRQEYEYRKIEKARKSIILCKELYRSKDHHMYYMQLLLLGNKGNDKCIIEISFVNAQTKKKKLTDEI